MARESINQPRGGWDTALLQQLFEYTNSCRYLQTRTVASLFGHPFPAECALINFMTTGELIAKPPSKSIAALLLLSFLWAVVNLRSDLLPNLDPNLAPESVPYFANRALPLALLAALSFVFTRERRENHLSIGQNKDRIRSQVWIAVLIGIALFVIPAIVAWFAKSYEPNSARTALFCLVPVFTIVFQPYLGSSDSTNHHALVAALVAFLGALCILPIDYPRSPQALLAFVALVLSAAGVGAANCLAEATANQETGPASPDRVPFRLTMVIAASTAAILLILASAVFDRNAWNSILKGGLHSGGFLIPAILWSLFLEFPALLLLFWSMKRLPAIRLSTRYLLAPLLTILLGIVLLRVEGAIQPRTWIGLLLIASGVAYLLFIPDANPSPNTLFSSNPSDRKNYPD